MSIDFASFERVACKKLGLLHPTKKAEGIYHKLGSFVIAESEDATRIVARKWQETVRRFLNKLEERGEPAPQMEKFRNQYDFPSYGEYLQQAKKIDPDFASPDLRGYRWYLKKKCGNAWKLLSREVPALFPETERLRHTYIVGSSGSGKSELLKVLIHSYATKPEYAAVVVLDPHAEFIEQVAKWPEVAERLVYIDPVLRRGMTPVFNPFEFVPATDDPEQERQIIAQEIVSALRQLIAAKESAFSLNMETVLHPCVLVLLHRKGSTFRDLYRFMQDGDPRSQIPGNNEDLLKHASFYPRDHVRNFFKNSWRRGNPQTKKAIEDRLQALLDFPAFEHLTCGKTTFDLEALLDERKIVLFNLGRVDQEVGAAFGRLVVATLQGIARRRVEIDKAERTPIHLFIDEAHMLVSESIEKILTGTRKFGLHLTLAQPSVGYNMSPALRAIVTGGTRVKFVGQMDDTGAGRTVAADLVAGNLSEMRRFNPGTFYVKSGNTFILHTATDLLGDKNTVTKEAWEKTEQEQLLLYYRLIQPEIAESGLIEAPSVQNIEGGDEDIDLSKGGRW